MIEVFSLEYLQHGMWVYGPAIIGRPSLANNLAQIACLPGVSAIDVQQVDEENCEDFGLNPSQFDGQDYVA
jgi:hypothetical protein